MLGAAVAAAPATINTITATPAVNLRDRLRASLVLLAVYLLAALVSLPWWHPSSHVPALWYANSAAAALVLRRPVTSWPLLAVVLALAVLLVRLTAGDTLAQALLLVPAHLAEVLLAAWALRRAGVARSNLRSPGAWLVLLSRGALLAPLVGATLGTVAAALQAPGPVPFAQGWLRWFQGSAIGAVGMLPLACLVLSESPAALRRELLSQRLLLLALLSVLVTLLAMAVLPYPFIIMSLPLLLAAMVVDLTALSLLVFLVSLTGAAAILGTVFVLPVGTDEVWLAFVYVAFAASLIPAQLLGAALADLRDSHARLQARERELARANDGLEQFVRMASHDLREPVNTITQFGRLLHDDHGHALPADARRYLGLMNSGAMRLRELLDDVLHFARVQRGVLDDVEPVLLDEVLADVQAALAARIQRSGALIDVGPLPPVRGQASMLQLLFQNLLSNAIKFVGPGQRPVVHISAESDAAPPHWVRVTVSDQGIGIAQADLGKLFQPFQRLHLRRAYEGTGLGLALARRVAQAHGGDIEVQSTPGQGSRFIVTLPPAELDSAHALLG